MRSWAKKKKKTCHLKAAIGGQFVCACMFLNNWLNFLQEIIIVWSKYLLRYLKLSLFCYRSLHTMMASNWTDVPWKNFVSNLFLTSLLISCVINWWFTTALYFSHAGYMQYIRWLQLIKLQIPVKGIRKMSISHGNGQWSLKTTENKSRL